MLSRRRLLAHAGVAGAGGLALGCSVNRAQSARAGIGAFRRVPDTHGEWWVPEAPRLAPTVVLVHGGYWQPGFTRHLEDDLAADLCRRGYLIWNIDYQPADSGWPAPLTSAATAYDHLTSGRCSNWVDRKRIAIVGHSAGGQLALWLASRDRLPAGVPGSVDEKWLQPTIVVGQAPVAALTAAANEGLGGGAVVELCGGTPEVVPDRYRVADPCELVPASCPVTLIHGRDDDIVPVTQSRRYQTAAQEVRAAVELFVVAGGHFDHLEPSSAACRRLRAVLATTLTPAEIVKDR